VADAGFWGSVPIPRCHAEGIAEVRSSDPSARSVEKKIMSQNCHQKSKSHEVRSSASLAS